MGDQTPFVGPDTPILRKIAPQGKPEPISFEITDAVALATQTSAELTVKGRGARMGTSIEITVENLPGRPKLITSHAQAGGNGEFEWTREWDLVRGSTEDKNVDVLVSATDVSTGKSDTTSVKGGAWVVTA